MPELPEVETTRLGLLPHLKNQRIAALNVRDFRLRWPISPNLPKILVGLQVIDLRRRAKYLLIDCGSGTLIVHLGMSGSLRVLSSPNPPGKHDHYDLNLLNGNIIRYTDPRRFGSLHWSEVDPSKHPLLAKLGPEPLSEAFTGRTLFHAARGRTASIKQFLMDQHHVVGVGNIYANEALFRAAVRPQTRAGRVSLARCENIVASIKHTLNLALKAGGSTLRDFVNSNGDPGSFQLSYRVYDRAGQPRFRCNGTIRTIRQGQRSTFYCPNCQT